MAPFVVTRAQPDDAGSAYVLAQGFGDGRITATHAA